MNLVSVFWCFVLVAVTVAGAVGVSSTREDPDGRLSALRSQIQRYESPIIHTSLARFALAASTELELHLVQSLHTKFPQSDPEVATWLHSQAGSQFNSRTTLPHGTQYQIALLSNDEASNHATPPHTKSPLDKQPQEDQTVAQFVQAKLDTLKHDPSLDIGSAVLLDRALLQLVSARILLGHQVALAKFDADKPKYCELLTKHPVSNAAIQSKLTDRKQEARVLARVQEKAMSFSQLFPGDPEYPPHSADFILRLFQAYIIPITTQVEVQTILAQASLCTSPPAPST